VRLARRREGAPHRRGVAFDGPGDSHRCARGIPHVNLDLTGGALRHGHAGRQHQDNQDAES
jgi:hypothetical protein